MNRETKCSCLRLGPGWGVLACLATLLLWCPFWLIKSFYWHAKSLPVSHPNVTEHGWTLCKTHFVIMKQQCVVWLADPKCLMFALGGGFDPHADSSDTEDTISLMEGWKNLCTIFVANVNLTEKVCKWEKAQECDYFCFSHLSICVCVFGSQWNSEVNNPYRSFTLLGYNKNNFIFSHTV